MTKSFNHIIILLSIIGAVSCGTTLENSYSSRGKTFGNDTISVLKKTEKIKILTIENYTYQEFPNHVINKLTQLEEITIISRKWGEILYNRNTEIDTLEINISGLDSLTQLNTINFSGFTFNSFPYELGLLENLETLNIWLGGLQEFPEDLSGFKNLKTLRLSDNEIMRISNSVVLPNTLKELNISSNKLTHFPLEIIPENLTKLDLSLNNFNLDKKIELILYIMNKTKIDKLIVDARSSEEMRKIKHLVDYKKFKKRIKIIKTPANITYSI
ncbi:MAG: leucine-rich repeat domain-containing protein [Bacteroidales bacterium]|nr:leucine-rich repeat domain-containing protein [Bacteroidales bacterium]